MGFERPVPPGGYIWWYVDGFSDDGRHAITLIVFIGSVFSPYYAWAGRGDPQNHCAFNLALYGDRKRWTMTERASRALSRDAAQLSIGPSRISWSSQGFLAEIDEMAVPVPRRVRGRIHVSPHSVCSQLYPLDPDGRHVWRPIATMADIRVEFSEPRLSWTGAGYIDMNYGAVPLEQDFRSWNWSRGRSGRGANIFYDTVLKNGVTRQVSLAFDGSGRASSIAPPPVGELPRASIWRMPRAARSDAHIPPRVIETLEDTPFYARSLIEQCCEGERMRAIHESVSLQRFDTPIVKAMLPFRMPRRP